MDTLAHSLVNQTTAIITWPTNSHSPSLQATDVYKLLPDGLNISSLLSMIHNLTPQARDKLFSKLGMASEDDLKRLVGGAMGVSHEPSEAEMMHYREYRAHKFLRTYVPPVLLILGTFGNICSFFILRHKAMARQSTHHFLAALAVMDSLVLYVGLFRKWLGELTGMDVKNEGEWLCKTIVMLGYTFSNVSVWIIVAVTVERYIVVCHPLKASRVCNVTRAKRAVVGIVLLFLVINLHFLWTAGLTLRQANHGQQPNVQCQSHEDHDVLITAVWPWIDALIYGFAPFAIIVTLNVIIIVNVVRATSGRHILQNRDSLCSPSGTRMTRRYVQQSSSQHELFSLSRSNSNCSMASTNYASSNADVRSSGSVSNGHSPATSSPNNLTVPGQAAPSASRRRSGGSARGGVAGCNGCSNVVTTNRRFTSNSSVRMTVMLLSVSFTFLITTLPMNVCVIASVFWNQQSKDLARMSKFQLVFTVAELLMYVNHSVNFFLYCATGHKFRSQMRRMVCGKARSIALSFDHSQHIYCSRICIVEGFTELRTTEETRM